VQYQLWLSDGYIDDSSIPTIDLSHSTNDTSASASHKRKRGSPALHDDNDGSGNNGDDDASSAGYVYRLRLECTIGSSDKFYELELEGAEVRIRYGRRGSQGVLAVSSFGSVVEAREFMETTAEGKRRKGYVDCIDSDVGTATARSPQAMSAARSVGESASRATASPTRPLARTRAPRVTATAVSSSISSSASSDSGSGGDVIYLVCTEGGSDKFYEIRVSGTRVKLSYGRRGSQGVSTVKQFGSSDEAKKFAQTTAKAKRRKGYSDSSPDGDDEDGNDEAGPVMPIASRRVADGTPSNSSLGGGQQSSAVDSNAADDGATDLDRLERGERVFVKGSSALPYTLKKFNGGYSCTCMGWKLHIKKRGINCCSCKHLRELRGEAAEDARCAAGGPPPGGSGASASSSRGSASSSSSGGAKNLAIPKKISLAQKWTGSIDLTLYAMSEVCIQRMK
jgi:predicted DNA-binding WGR domain protein